MITIENCYSDQAISVNTDFNIQEFPSLKSVIEQIEGIEEIIFFGAYNHRLILKFGKAFDREDIKEQVTNKINDYINKFNSNSKQ